MKKDKATNRIYLYLNKTKISKNSLFLVQIYIMKENIQNLNYSLINYYN